jgi:predicted DNA-binding transcriptional regulator YafY
MSNKTIVRRQQKEKQLLLENLRKIPIIEVACNRSAVGRATYYRWRKEDVEFTKQADEALSEGIKLINDLSESQLLSAIKEKNITAIFYWLNHRHPAYGNKVEITTTSKPNEKLSKEQEEVVRKAIKLAAIKS